MKILASIRTTLRRFATFSGRASQEEFWHWFLFYAFLHGALFPVMVMTGIMFVLILPWILILPSTALAWRRMHDTGRAGWPALFFPVALVILPGGFWDQLRLDALPFLLVMAVLFVSSMLVLYWLVRPGDPGHNAYGPPPA